MQAVDAIQWVSDNLPETVLLVGGVLAVLIVVTYLKDKESFAYKFFEVLGFIAGIVMVYEAVAFYGQWDLLTSVIVAVTGFALMIRPLREAHFAVLIALFAMALVYIWLGGLTDISGIDVTFLNDDPARIVVAFVIGALVYAMLHFAEALVQMIGKILNLWPLLGILAVLCIAEAALLLMDAGTLLDYVDVDL